MDRGRKRSDVAPSVHNLDYLETVYEVFRQDADAVSQEWRAYFGANGGGESARAGAGGGAPAGISEGGSRALRGEPARSPEPSDAVVQERLNQLIRCYRVRGHIVARVDPLGARAAVPRELDPATFGFCDKDLDRSFECESLFWPGPLTLREILERLRNTYCRFIGVQYMHIDDFEVRRWLQQRMEGTQNRIQLSRKVQYRILTRLTDAVIFEGFVRKKFLGAKTFSLEGCESLIPLLDLAIEKAGEQGVKEIVLGMAHRGRLNVLVNIIHKSASQIFHEFEEHGIEEEDLGGGDVRYHLGHSNDWLTAGGARLHLSLTFNPSHLEFVNPVALGRVRAKQDRVGDTGRDGSMALLIHGDASFAGEGIVQESLNLGQLPAYTTGGTLHVIVNNQIGFTTSPLEARSSVYATDVARMLQVPVFHVNGEDPESVAQCLHVAMEFRKQFKRDVFLDMYGYRRWGHNEADEPSFTQPLMYRAIEQRPSVRESYLQHLLELNGLSEAEVDRIARKRREQLESGLSEARHKDYRPPGETRRGIWARSRYHGGLESTVEEVRTGVDLVRLQGLLRQLTSLPEDFTPHPKVRRFRERWEQMAEGRKPVDWSAAEALAFATLATEGIRVRLSGQDSARGTFSQRHAVLHDYQNGRTYTPLQHLAREQAPVEVYNSPLSEAGVLGFEYGYSLECPDGLVLWEAQFGDFGNAAQVIIDQFLASAEDKWRRLSGLVLLLPHGFEGMGPEHSSARLERFLNLSAEDNIQVVNPSTPAQYFHLLRRQALRLWRKPLVVMTPKSLLRNPECHSSLGALAGGSFERVIPDAAAIETPRRVLLCCGKIYYELAAHRSAKGHDDVAILRVEQLYPWRQEVVQEALRPYPRTTEVAWVQEEPRNMGAWPFLQLRLPAALGGRPLSGVSRPESASPAAGLAAAHKLEQRRLIESAFANHEAGEISPHAY
jgi:2-oxoglutarate dehydrogenase E1 component